VIPSPTQFARFWLDEIHFLPDGSTACNAVDVKLDPHHPLSRLTWSSFNPPYSEGAVPDLLGGFFSCPADESLAAVVDCPQGFATVEVDNKANAISSIEIFEIPEGGIEFSNSFK